MTLTWGGMYKSVLGGDKVEMNKKIQRKKQAGAELGQAQLKLKLGCTSTMICFIKLMIAYCYQPL